MYIIRKPIASARLQLSQKTSHQKKKLIPTDTSKINIEKSKNEASQHQQQHRRSPIVPLEDFPSRADDVKCKSE